MPAPDLAVFLNEWWGGGSSCAFDWASGVASLASNYLVGGNPLYQISDFLAMYPKFGTQPESILAVSIANGGMDYAPGDNVIVLQPDASGGVLGVAAVNGSGAVTGFTAIDPAGTGTGYTPANALPTTGGHGTGLTVNVLTISMYTSAVGIPQTVIQAYLNLASAALQSVRWGETWPIAMGLYIAHFLTLYLRSEGAIGSTPQQVAASGLERGIKVAEAAGDVSKTSQLLAGMEEWGAFMETTYGAQLATFAKGISMPHSMYFR